MCVKGMGLGAKTSTCAGLTLIGSLSTIQVTLSRRGGVVKEPS